MYGLYNSASEDGSDYSYYSDSDSDLDFYNGYSEKPRRRVSNYVSLPKLKSEYNENMPMESKILLFLNAGEEEDIPFMERLLMDDVSVDCVGQDGWTALMKACLNGKLSVVDFLLENGSNPNYQADLFNSLMACCTISSASEESKLACMELLLQNNADVNMNDKHKTTPFMHAASSGFLNIINKLLTVEGIKIHTRDFDGWNAVFHAVSNNRIQVVKRLLECGLDYRSQDIYGRTPLVLAEERCYKNLAKMLVKIEEAEEVVEVEGDKVESYLKFLSELPQPDGQGGFESDTKEILSLYGCKNVNNISFEDFLNMNERDLYLAGVKVDSQRKEILNKVIHRFHLCPWRKTSMQAVTRGVAMGLEDGICIVGSIAKHLTLVKASLRYLRTRIQSRTKKGELGLQRETINALAACFYSNECMQNKLKEILGLLDYVEPFEAEDTIFKSPKNDSRMGRTLKYGLIVLGATTAGCLIFHFRLRIGGLLESKTLTSMKWL